MDLALQISRQAEESQISSEENQLQSTESDKHILKTDISILHHCKDVATMNSIHDTGVQKEK